MSAWRSDGVASTPGSDLSLLQPRVWCTAAPTLAGAPSTVARPSGSAYDFISALGEAIMRSVAQILKSKADPTIYTIGPAASVFEAVKLMAEKNIGALVVIEGERIAGIITERDYARKIVLMARSSKDTLVREIMSPSVMRVRPDQGSVECMGLMTENRVRHLPVVDNDKLIGVVSIGDLVKDIISQQEFVIRQMEHYITGERG
jgi:CBS domain-containing protein